MKTRILIIAVIFATLCPAISDAADLSTRPAMARLAALTTGTQTQRPMTPRPGVIRTACIAHGSRCENALRDCCAGL